MVWKITVHCKSVGFNADSLKVKGETKLSLVKKSAVRKEVGLVDE